MNVIKDFFDKKILKYTFLPFLISIIFWAVIFLVFKDFIYSFIFSYISHLPFSNAINQLLSGIGSGIVILVLYYFSVISTLGVFSSFFIDKIVLRINEKYYNCPVRETKLKDNVKGIWISLKTFFIYFIVFVFTFFLLFIPVINIIYEMFLLTILNKKPLVFDSSYLFLEPEKIEKENKWKINLLVFFSTFIYFFPFVSLFGYTFQLILMTHFVLKKCKGKE
jgi:uncharacterized protein involved in cysteine biosynthesis